MHTSIATYRPLNHERDKVKQLIPQYLRDSATNLISFMEEYYVYLNREGFASYELNHIIDENDIDFTSEKYLNAIQGEIAKIVPNSSVIDRNTLYKRIVHYYRVKGTPESVQAFFTLMFDTLVDVYYPGDNLFKLSSGTYDNSLSQYTKDAGFLSGADKIQDSEFWQDFSYQISSDIESYRWIDSFSRLVHPAGMKFFALVVVSVIVKSRWDRFESYTASSNDPDAWLVNLRPPRLRGINAYEGSHTPKYQPGWLGSTIAQLIEAVYENYYATPSDPNTDLSRVAIIQAIFRLTSSRWSNQINSDYYTTRGFWDDPEPLSELNVFETPLSNLINNYGQEYTGGRLPSAEAPQPAVEIDIFNSP